MLQNLDYWLTHPNRLPRRGKAEQAPLGALLRDNAGLDLMGALTPAMFLRGCGQEILDWPGQAEARHFGALLTITSAPQFERVGIDGRVATIMVASVVIWHGAQLDRFGQMHRRNEAAVFVALRGKGQPLD